MRAQERVDITAVDRRAAVVTPVAADWIRAPQVSPFDAVAAVMLDVRTLMRHLRTKPLELGKSRVAPRGEIAMRLAQLAKADFARNEQLAQYPFNRPGMLFKDRLEQGQMPRIFTAERSAPGWTR